MCDISGGDVLGGINIEMLYTMEGMSLFSLIPKMIHLGARPPSIAALTGLSDLTSKKIYRSVTGQRSPPGKMAKGSDSFFRTRGVLQQCSYLWSLFRRATNCGVSDGAAIVAAYEKYHLKYGDDSRISFDRALEIVFEIRRRINLKEVVCPSCGTRFIVTKAYFALKPAMLCPIHPSKTKQTRPPIKSGFLSDAEQLSLSF